MRGRVRSMAGNGALTQKRRSPMVQLTMVSVGRGSGGDEGRISPSFRVGSQVSKSERGWGRGGRRQGERVGQCFFMFRAKIQSDNDLFQQ